VRNHDGDVAAAAVDLDVVRNVREYQGDVAAAGVRGDVRREQAAAVDVAAAGAEVQDAAQAAGGNVAAGAREASIGIVARPAAAVRKSRRVKVMSWFPKF